jgi:broad specificity phosphatase PhoE
MLHVFLVRHAETDWNADHRYQGHSDPPLNANGLTQARGLAVRLATQKIDLIFSSDLLRARQTAEMVAAQRGIELRSDVRLREMNFGILEGFTFDQALQRWPDMISRWLADYNQPPDGAEGIDEFNRRVLLAWEDVSLIGPDLTVLIVAHGGPLRTILHSLLGLPEAKGAWLTLDHTALTEITLDADHIIINRLNDTGFGIQAVEQG